MRLKAYGEHKFPRTFILLFHIPASPVFTQKKNRQTLYRTLPFMIRDVTKCSARNGLKWRHFLSRVVHFSREKATAAAASGILVFMSL